MKEIIFATKNQGKLREVKAILDQYQIIGLDEAGIAIDVLEDGDTFEANALKKAVEIMKATGKITLSDDSGMEIDFFDKKPGVYSARFLGEHTPYTEKNAIILDMLKDVPLEKRTARYVAVIAAAFPNGQTLSTRGVMEGRIAWEAKGSNGFGYDPIFFLPDYGLSVAEMDPVEKNKISHRAIALQLMKEKLKDKWSE